MTQFTLFFSRDYSQQKLSFLKTESMHFPFIIFLIYS